MVAQIFEGGKGGLFRTAPFVYSYEGTRGVTKKKGDGAVLGTIPFVPFLFFSSSAGIKPSGRGAGLIGA